MAIFPPSVKIVVLIVEDELLVRMAIADAVEEAGFEVIESGNADEAVLILESRSDVRIVFTDIDMPGSMDGMKLAAAVRGRWPPIEIILTSGHHRIPHGDLPARSIFIPKPYAAELIVATLRQFIA
jgi:DNA-binding NtrC family response regulator